MSIKRRLIISNAAVVIVPLLITIAASFVFIIVSSKIFDTEINYKNVKKLSEIQLELFNANAGILNETPELLLEDEYQQYLATRFSEINADIIILKSHNVVFSTIDLNQIDIEKCLTAANNSFTNKSIDLYGITYIVRDIPVIFRDGTNGNTILLAPVRMEWMAARSFIYFALIIFICVFIITNLIISVSFSKSILHPLSELQTAAGEISRGSLDHEVIERGEGEISDLCRSFEQMRLKLKDSVHTQLKYDDNRKVLVSSISHDLKTPITSIKGYVEGILDGVANSPEKVKKYLNTIYSKAVQVDSMIDDLLLYSKLDLNQIPFNFEKTDIVSYFEDCITDIEPELEKTGICIALHNKINTCKYIIADRERLARVVTNIIDNARKYMDKAQGRIDITLRETASSVIVEMQDNGSGIPAKDLPHIFDRFYRADSTRQEAVGSGLGLAIAKQIVEGHGGKIWIRSHEKKGTSIMMSFNKLNT